MQTRETVEIFHLLFLAELGRSLDKQLYAVKGGCNLRFFFGSPRYSEDLDLDVRTIERGTLARKVSRLLDGRALTLVLSAHEIAIRTVSAPKQTDTTQRWKIELNTGNSVVRTKIEFSRRGLEPGTAFDPVDPALIGRHGLSPVLLTHYGARAAFLQKARALAGRARTQARDVFDLDLLLRAGKWPKALPTAEQRDLAQARSNALTVTFDDYVGQVKAYLSEDEPGVPVTKRDWENAVLRVSSGLEALEQ